MAIFQDQPINLEAVKGVSPERFVQRAEREQQAVVGNFLRMQQGIQQGIQQFEQKREEKQNMAASLQLLKELGAVEGLSDESIKAGIKNAGGATNFLKTISELGEAQRKTAPIRVEDIGMGRGAVMQGDRALQVFGLPGQETEEKTAAIRNYEYFVDEGIMTEEEARKIFFGDGDSTASALSKFLSGEGGNDVPTGGTEPVEEPEVEAEDEEAEEPKATVLSARQRAVQEMQTKERAERPAGPAKMAPGLTPEQQARLQELLLKQQGL